MLHRGADPVAGRFQTAPVARSKPFRFTSFGDQAIPAAVGTGLGPHSPNAGFIVDAVEAMDPLFHLMNGDLCYANVSDAPVATWSSFFNNNMRSAANRAWMPYDGVVITGIGRAVRRCSIRSVIATEPGDWSAYRDLQTPTALPRSELHPAVTASRRSRCPTSVRPQDPANYQKLDTFTLQRPRKRHADGSELADVD